MLRVLAIAALCLGTAACQSTVSAPEVTRGGTGSAEIAAGMSGGDALNAARRAHGLPALRPSRQLAAAAYDQASFMAATGARTHAGAGGSTMAQRVRRNGCSFQWAAENIAWGHRSDASAMDWWMNSPGHRANSLSPRPTHYGWATVGTQRVLVLASGC